jgi:chaperonin GroES
MKGENMAKQVQPLGDKVLVRPLSQEETTKSGIVLPDVAKEKPQEGEVIAVGKGKFVEGKLVPLDVKVGDKVLFTKYGPTEIEVDGQELLIVEEKDILGIIK